ncbi:MAG: hypothetical protein OK456_03830 [Thaumarchaeota archaeon]|nr:hypothetical protein [Nitrososphaerota archaeon]
MPFSGPTKSVKLALASVFAAVIALGTILSIPIPPPVFEITWSPAIYLALAVLADNWTAATATGIGSFIGELYNINTKAGGSPIYPFGLVWARVPEIFIVAWGAHKGGRWLVASMVVATIFETFAFLISDGLFYSYGLFGYGSPTNLASGFYLALPDLATLADLFWIFPALLIIRAARPSFKRLGFPVKDSRV